MKKSLWLLGKKVIFTLVFVVLGFYNLSIAIPPVEVGALVRIKNVKTGCYLTAEGNDVFARREPTQATVFKIVADVRNVAIRNGDPVKFGDQVYLMLNDSSLFMGVGGVAMVYGKRNLLGLGTKDQNPLLFNFIYAPMRGKAVPNFVPYGEIIRLQTKIRGAAAYVGVNVDISTSPKGLEAFFTDWRMTPLAIEWASGFVLEFVSRDEAVNKAQRVKEWAEREEAKKRAAEEQKKAQLAEEAKKRAASPVDQHGFTVIYEGSGSFELAPTEPAPKK